MGRNGQHQITRRPQSAFVIMNLTHHADTSALRRFPILVPALAVWLASTPLQADWPQFRGADGQGVSPQAELPLEWSATLNLRWKTELPGPGGSSPVVFGDRIYLTCYTGYAVPGSPGGNLDALQRHLLCFRRADGTLLWQKEVPAAQPEQARVRDHGYATSTPAADADGVYVFFGKSGVFAFTHEGEPRWQAQVGTQTDGWGSAASPRLHGEFVIVNAAVESGSLVALNRRTGREVWRAGGMKESWNTPVIVPLPGGKPELVVAIAGQVLGFAPDSGQQLWSCATGIGWYMVPSLVHHDGVVYCIGGRTGGSLAVRAGGEGEVTSTRRLWTLNKGSNVSSPVFHEGHLYFLHENLGVAYCVEAATGRLVFEERLNRADQFYPSPVLAQGRLYCLDRRGTTFVLAAKPEFQMLARNELRDRSSFDASPAVAGDRLLLRSDKFLYCVGSR